MKRKNDENCVVADMCTVFWFNKQNEFENILEDARHSSVLYICKYFVYRPIGLKTYF